MAALAAFAISAMAASSASAGTYYSCVEKKDSSYTTSTCKTLYTKKGKVEKKGKFEKVVYNPCVAKKKGKYENATCTKIDPKAGKGKYEKKPIKFTAATGEAKLSTPAFGANDVECTSSTTAGELTGAKTDTEVVTFHGCKFEGLPCETVGSGSETLVTNKLASKLIDNGEKGDSGLEPALGEVWDQLTPETPPYFIEFTCGGVVKLRTEGSISGLYTTASLNVMSESSVLEFGEGKGEQDLYTEAEEGEGWVGPAPSLQLIEAPGATITTSAYAEVRS
ncbi:MAG: hypothetical protein ACRD6W_11005 [Nitrososphaerales archaeon]